MGDNNTYSLADLNELSEGLGNCVERLLEQGARNYAELLKAKEEIIRLLDEIHVAIDEVLVERGLAAGSTIDAALRTASDNFYFRDAFDG